MLQQLSSSHDNGQSMVINPSGKKQAPSVVIDIGQRSENRDNPLMYKIYSVSCHHLSTMVRAWLLVPKIWNMFRKLSSSHDNVQSIVISPQV